MKLIIFRHGLAVERDIAIAKKMEDSLRPLTEKGRDRTRKMAKYLREEIGETQLIVSSHLVRAQQTAALIAEILPHEKYVESAELVPDAPVQAFANWLKTHASTATSAVVVGHEPQLGNLVSWLLAGTSTSFLDLKKSGVVMLEVESFADLGPRSAELKWMLSPKFV